MTSPVQCAATGPPGQFVLDGERYEIVTWEPLLTVLPYRRDWHQHVLVDLLHPSDADALDDRLVDDDDPLTPAGLVGLAEQLVRAATGQPWYVVARLLGYAGDRWPEVDGALALRGIDLLQMVRATPARAVNVLYAALIEHTDENQRARLDAELTAPPPGAVRGDVPDWAIEDDARMFLAAHAAGARM